jgi:HSP20 family protein
MIRWRFYEPNPLREMLDQMVHESRRTLRESARGEPMPVNVHETEDAVVVEAVLPGVKPEDVDVQCGDGVLTIGASSSVQERDYFHQEYHSLEYHRQLAIPSDCRYDAATAELEHGVLTIRIPKLKPKAPEKIKIEVSRKNQAGATPIEATKGDGYEEVAPPRRQPGTKPKAARKPPKSS